MTALLLGLLLSLLLDQNDRGQRMTQAMGESGLLATGRWAALVIAILSIAALPVAIGGAAMADAMPAKPRLLLFSITLIAGGGAMLLPAPSKEHAQPSNSSITSLAGHLLAARITGRCAFALFGTALVTGNAPAAAAGTIMGSMIALLPPLLLGGGYRRALPVPLLARIAGALLLVLGLLCALSALDLL